MSTFFTIYSIYKKRSIPRKPIWMLFLIPKTKGKSANIIPQSTKNDINGIFHHNIAFVFAGTRTCEIWIKKPFFRKPFLWHHSHLVKSVRVRSFSGLFFWFVVFRSECGKIRTRKTPNTDTLHAASSYVNHNHPLLNELTHFVTMFPQKQSPQVFCKKVCIRAATY